MPCGPLKDSERLRKVFMAKLEKGLKKAGKKGQKQEKKK